LPAKPPFWWWPALHCSPRRQRSSRHAGGEGAASGGRILRCRRGPNYRAISWRRVGNPSRRHSVLSRSTRAGRVRPDGARSSCPCLRVPGHRSGRRPAANDGGPGTDHGLAGPPYGRGLLLAIGGVPGPRGTTTWWVGWGNEDLLHVPRFLYGHADPLPADGSLPADGPTAHRWRDPSRPASWSLVTERPRQQVLRLRLTTFPGWHASIDGQPCAGELRRGDCSRPGYPPGRQPGGAPLLTDDVHCRHRPLRPGRCRTGHRLGARRGSGGSGVPPTLTRPMCLRHHWRNGLLPLAKTLRRSSSSVSAAPNP